MILKKIFSFLSVIIPPSADNNEIKKIHRFLSILRRRLMAVYFFHTIIECCGVTAVIFLCAFFSLAAISDENGKMVFGYFFGLTFLVLLILLIVRRLVLFLKNSSNKSLIDLTERTAPHLKDDLTTSYSLLNDELNNPDSIINRNNSMRALALTHITNTENKLDDIEPSKIISFPSIKKILRDKWIVLICLSVVVGMSFPDKSQKSYQMITMSISYFEWLQDLSSSSIVLPGKQIKEVRTGTDILFGIALPERLVLTSKGYPLIQPELIMIRTRGGRKIKTIYEISKEDISGYYHKNSSDSVLSSTNENYILWTKKFTADFPEEIKYYFSLKSRRITDEYSIKIIPPVVFSFFKIKYDYPSYMGIAPREVENELQLECYAGTRINIEAFTSTAEFPDEAFLYLDKEKIPMTIRRKMTKNPSAVVSFVVGPHHKSYRFLTVKNGQEYLSQVYPIEVKVDLTPEVRILSPSFDIEASFDDKIPIVWSAEDDFGIVKVLINIMVSEGSNDRQPRREMEVVLPIPPNSSKRQIISDYMLNLSAFRFDNEKSFSIKYFVTAQDNYGNKGRSEINAVIINSYHDSHDKILNNLEKISSDITDIWSEQIKARDILQGNTTSFLKWEEVNELQQKILSLSQSVTQKLDSTLKDMSRDPYFDGYLMEEYRGMSSTMKHLAENHLQKALSLAQRHNANELKPVQEEAISILENLSLLSSDVIKYQRVGDIDNNIGRVDKRLEYAIEGLSDFDGDEKKLKEIMSDLDEISRLISEIEHAIKDMPQMLPEEYVNSDALKKADFVSAQSSIDAIKDALMKGDVKESRRLIEELKNQLARLRDSLKRASESLSVRSSPAAMSQSFRRSSVELNDIIQKQKDILKKVSGYENKRLENFSRLQVKILSELAIKQKELITHFSLVVSSYNFYDGVVMQARSLMEKVHSEFAGGKVYNSRKYLEDIVGYLSSAKSRVDSKTILAKDISFVLEREKDIFNVLQSTPVLPFNGFNEREKKDLLTYANLQNDLKSEMDKLSGNIKKFTRQTAIVSYETIAKLDEASSYMLLSSLSLKDFDTFSSVEHQRKVIELLENSSEDLASAADSTSGMSFGSRPVPTILPSGSISNKEGISGGITGAMTSRSVKLPSAEDYKVPAAFREDLMKYLKERRPRDYYDDTILKYYKRLAE